MHRSERLRNTLPSLVQLDGLLSLIRKWVNVYAIVF